IFADGSTMYNGTMTDMGIFFQQNRYARKHVDGTVFLYITTIFNHDTAPVAPQRRPRTDINIFANYDIAGYHRLRMNKSRRMNNRNKTYKSVKHLRKLKVRKQKTNFQITKSSNHQIFKSPNHHIFKSSNHQITKSPNRLQLHPFHINYIHRIG